MPRSPNMKNKQLQALAKSHDTVYALLNDRIGTLEALWEVCDPDDPHSVAWTAWLSGIPPYVDAWLSWPETQSRHSEGSHPEVAHSLAESHFAVAALAESRMDVLQSLWHACDPNDPHSDAWTLWLGDIR